MFNFVDVERLYAPKTVISPDKISISKTAITIPAEIIESLNGEYVDEVILRYAVDLEAKAIRISVDDEGYMARRKDGTRSLMSGLPAPLKRLHMPRGLYKKVEGFDNVFQLVDSTRAEPMNQPEGLPEGLTEGDTVIYYKDGTNYRCTLLTIYPPDSIHENEVLLLINDPAYFEKHPKAHRSVRVHKKNITKEMN